MAPRKTPKASNSKPDKLMRDALMVALNREERSGGHKVKRVALIAEAWVLKAMGGDVQAIKEIRDSVDGKPTQTIAGDPERPLQFEKIERVIVDPGAKD